MMPSGRYACLPRRWQTQSTKASRSPKRVRPKLVRGPRPWKELPQGRHQTRVRPTAETVSPGGAATDARVAGPPMYLQALLRFRNMNRRVWARQRRPVLEAEMSLRAYNAKQPRRAAKYQP